MPPATIFRSVVSEEDKNLKKGGEFFRLIKHYNNKPLFVSLYVVAIIQGCMPIILTIFLGQIVNTLTGENFFDSFVPVIKSMIYYYVVYEIITPFMMELKWWTASGLIADLRKKVYTKFLDMGINYFDKTPTGIMIGRLSQDITLVHDIYVEKLFQAVNMGIGSIAGVILSFVKCWRATLPAAALVILCVLIYLIGNKLIDKIWVSYNDSSSAAANKAEEVISSFRTIKSFDNELYESDLYHKDLIEVDKVFKKTSIAQGIKDFLIATIAHLMLAMILYYGCYLIVERPYYGYENGSVFIMFMTMIQAVVNLTLAFSVSEDMSKAAVSAAKIIEILEAEPDFDRKKGKELKNVKGEIEFRDVCFKYESQSTNAIDHLSFVIKPGETVAFVGESGCGKSTTLQLIQRFYDIQSGQILIDGKDIKDYSPVSLRSFISSVPQSPVLYSMTILENIKISKEDATKKEVVRAAQIGNAHNFIMSFPNQYVSTVHQTSLSGGQKQRICISRAILADAPILLLDEATAALDTESERLVQESLEKFRHGKTAIMVAHRLATVKNADRILVFQNGHILEEGTHKQLLAKGGFYADLVKYQLQ
ncbi:ABC transporter family protein [Histomonas meleagridis]|uniref:ABC transporter family protein n=1 Tax=Histomonas meleagridis TaxID=135588 RepID=UPI00355A8A9A|nr:ABC transporter family protein [Histomonas meleagridis]KAH0799499.1 ABC transporter family protein [Histomonas meleagridis]